MPSFTIYDDRSAEMVKYLSEEERYYRVELLELPGTTQNLSQHRISAASVDGSVVEPLV